MVPPYPFIADKLQKGSVIPFLGSATSLAGVPASSKRLPDGRGLATELRRRCGNYPGDDSDPLMKVAQFYEECVCGRTPLYSDLREIFYVGQQGQPPAPVPEFLASVNRSLLIITTNYDSHLEQAYANLGKPFTVLTHITNREHPQWGFILVQRSIWPDKVEAIEPGKLLLSDYGADAIIYKIHCTFSSTLSPAEDSIVITENDYAEFLVMAEMKSFPPAIARALQNQHVLFLGYSLEDWNFRVILRKLQLTAGLGRKYLWWAIQRDPSKIEERFWQKRNVELFSVDLQFFVQEIVLVQRQMEIWG
jgi:hypothetical protein